MNYRIIQDGWIKIPSEEFHTKPELFTSDRALIGLNQVLIHISGKNVLLDCGLGDKWKPSEISLLDSERPRRLKREIEKTGLTAGDIDVVIFSHLHYDHSGGGTFLNEKSKAAPAFPNAEYIVQKTELDYAGQPEEAYVTDFKPEDWTALEASGQLTVIDGEYEIVPNLTVYPAPGHTPGHQVAVAKFEDRILFYPGDLIPSRLHLEVDNASEYDMDKEIQMEHRRKWVQIARESGWTCVFCHEIRKTTMVL